MLKCRFPPMKLSILMPVYNERTVVERSSRRRGGAALDWGGSIRDEPCRESRRVLFRAIGAARI